MAEAFSDAERDELIAFIDGEASPDTIARIRENPVLIAAAETYARAQHGLRSRLYRCDCPPSQQLGDYELGLLPPAERVRIATHITICPNCLAEIRTLRAFLADEPQTSAPGIITQVRNIVASLLPTPAPLANLRGADTSTMQTYHAGDVTIDIDIATAGQGKLTLTGLLWRNDADADMEVFAGSLVTLLSGDAIVQTTVLDALGNFTFDNIAPGTYTVEVKLGDDQITIEGASVSL